MELQTLNMINFMLFIPCIFLQLIYWPTNTLSKTHLITSINLLRFSTRFLYYTTLPNTTHFKPFIWRSLQITKIETDVWDTVWLLWNNYSIPHIAAMWVFPQMFVYNLQTRNW